MEFRPAFGVALGTILLPTLSKHAASQDTEQFSGLLDWGLRLCMLLTLPAAVGLAVLSFPLVTTLFMYREFTLHDAQMTQYALIAYSFGLIGLIMIKVLAPGFYARQNIKTPVKVAIFTLICTQLMNLAFISPLKHVGLSLAIGLGACLNAGLLFSFCANTASTAPAKVGLRFWSKWPSLWSSWAAVCGWRNLICRLNGYTSAALKKQANSAS